MDITLIHEEKNIFRKITDTNFPIPKIGDYVCIENETYGDVKKVEFYYGNDRNKHNYIYLKYIDIFIK